MKSRFDRMRDSDYHESKQKVFQEITEKIETEDPRIRISVEVENIDDPVAGLEERFKI